MQGRNTDHMTTAAKGTVPSFLTYPRTLACNVARISAASFFLFRPFNNFLRCNSRTTSTIQAEKSLPQISEFFFSVQWERNLSTSIGKSWSIGRKAPDGINNTGSSNFLCCDGHGRVRNVLWVNHRQSQQGKCR